MFFFFFSLQLEQKVIIDVKVLFLKGKKKKKSMMNALPPQAEMIYVDKTCKLYPFLTDFFIENNTSFTCDFVYLLSFYRTVILFLNKRKALLLVAIFIL